MKAAVGPTDGIVQVELSLDGREAEMVLAVLRMGCAAWEHAPGGAADLVTAAARCAQVRRFIDELAGEIHRTHDTRQAAYRAEAKADAAAARAKERARAK